MRFQKLSDLLRKMLGNVRGLRAFQNLRRSIDLKIARPISEDEISESLVEFEIDDGDKIIQQINLEYSGVYSKASSLLAHVSMMIAALSFIYGTVQGNILKNSILINIILYLISLIFILRVIWVPTFQEKDVKRRQRILAEELTISQRYLRIAHLMAVGLTFMVILLLVLRSCE